MILAGPLKMSPGEIDGLTWISEQHSDLAVEVAEVRDAPDAGWLNVYCHGIGKEGGHAVARYLVSPTGRVFKARGQGTILEPWNQGEQVYKPPRD